MPPVTASLFPPHRRVARLERPNYGEHDVGLVKELVRCDGEKKKAVENYQGVKARLALLQSEEAKLSIQLKKAQVYQRALDQKKELVELREVEMRRKTELEEINKNEKVALRKYERDRKEKARDRMEELYLKKRNEICREKEAWERTKHRYERGNQEYISVLTTRAKEDKSLTLERRQRIQDSLDTVVVSRAEERAKERRRNEGYLKQRKAVEAEAKASAARERREAAKEHQLAYFENRVKDNKGAVVDAANMKVNMKKAAVSEMCKEAARLEQQEYKLRQKLEQQKQQLQETYTPLASVTPRIVRKR